MADSTEDKEVWEVKVTLDKTGNGFGLTGRFYNKKGEQVPMGCCGENKVPTPPPPAEEPEPEPEPGENPPGTIPEIPIPPGTPVPPEELPDPVPDPEPPPVEEPDPDPIPEPDPIPPGDPVPPPPDPPEDPEDPPELPPPEELPPPIPQPLPEPPPPSNEFDLELVAADGTSAINVIGDIVIPNGKKYRAKNVKIKGNIRTEGTGTLSMRPGDKIEFVGVNTADYVGGGATWAPQFAKDYGIWITPGGKLDIRGTPKLSWSRAGQDASWAVSDEKWISPTDVNDFAPRRFFDGTTVPQVHPTLPAAEVMNVTRDITITNGHIHIASNAAHRIEYFQMIGMGISDPSSFGAVLGRYCLHFHHSGDMGGLVIKGVSSIGARGKVFVPHGCTNLTFFDCVAVDSYDHGFFWDHGHETSDIVVDRLCVSGVYMPDAIGGTQSNQPGINLGAGINMTMKNSVVSGVRGGPNAAGFDWPEPTAIFGDNPDLVWVFEPGNVAHNNVGTGLRFWTNLADAHIVKDYKSYRNYGPGITNGAYFVATEYINVYTYQDGTGNYNNDEIAGILYGGNSTTNSLGHPGRVIDSIIGSLNGPAFKIGHRQLDYTVATHVENCKFIPGTGRDHVLFGPGGDETKPGLLHFINCLDKDDNPLTPSHFGILTRPGHATEHDGSQVIIYGATIADPQWQIDVINGVLVSTPL